MLDGFEPEGMETLHTVAAWFIGTGIVLAALAAAVGIYLWLGSKTSKFSGDKAAKGLRATGLSLAGAACLANVSGAIAWGSATGGTEAMMPAEARPQNITVEREAPVTTCGLRTGVRNFDAEDDVLSHEERVDIFQEVAADAEPLGQSNIGFDEGLEQLEDLEDTDTTFVRMVWTPIGPGCDGTNLTAAPGTEISVRTTTPNSPADQAIGAAQPRAGGFQLQVPGGDQDE